MAGQLAGAIHGRRGIPEHWVERLAFGDAIEARAGRLLALNLGGEG
nr:hypothetical protein [Sphingomonas sp. PL-96]